MRAIRIDAENRSLSYIDVDTLESKQAVVGGLLAGTGYFDNNDFMMVDDEGLLKNPMYFFVCDGFHQPFAGNGLVVGTSEVEGSEGEDIDCVTTIEELSKQIVFMDVYEMQLYATNMEA